MRSRFVLAVLLTFVVAISVPGRSLAQHSMGAAGHGGAMDHGGMMGHGADDRGGTRGQAVGAMSDAEVRKVDMEAGKLTLRHGPIPAADMPAMTMIYPVKDAAMLEGLDAGDKVRFVMDKVGGTYTVTQIERAK